ncbi:hypothetical protein, partial [Flavobacterium sp.]|uniref:hypothetical protein n=1 Tax=Flavobacterium sp. TaxID=239 RepID=UPI00391D16D0
MKQLSLKSKKVNLLFSFKEKKQVKKSTFSISTKVLVCFFVVLSLTPFAKVNAQCSTVISSSLPINSVATVTTFAGSGAAGTTNGTGTAASFNTPIGVARDAVGNVYVADLYNNLIRKITPAGIVSTFAGSGVAGNANGTGTAASFNSPIGITTDPSGNVFVADLGNNLIRMITPAGVVSTLAGSGIAGNTNGTGTAASFRDPFGLGTDAAGNVYVAERGNDLIRMITPAGVVTTFAGSGVSGNANGTGTAASFNNPTGIDTDAAGNLYVSDFGNNLIRKITPAGVVTTLAGSGVPGFTNGTGTAASFNGPFGVGTDPLGNIYVADRGNNVLRKITPAGVVTTLAGSGVSGNANGTGTSASFNAPVGITTDAIGNIYVADQNNNVIRRIVTNETVKVCSGSPVTLTANGGVSYSWSGPQVITNGVAFNATASGVFTVTVTTAGGCTVSDVITIDISLPTVSAASSTPSVCINTALTNITHTTSGSQGIGSATGLPAGVTASWATNTITISGTPTTDGTFNYTIPLIDGCGSVQATGTITVATAITVSAASSTPTLCINTALTPITHTTTMATGIGTAIGLPTGVTATWASNTITISGTPTSSGTFIYNIPILGSCATINATGTINVNPANTIVLSSASGPDVQSLCINTPIINITYNTSGATGAVFTGLPAGVTGTWGSNLATISGTPTVTGTFNYTATLTGGCGTASGTITIVSVAPASSAPRVCINTALAAITHGTVNATGIGIPSGLPPGVTASWASNTITINGTPTVIGTYNYTIPVNGACNATGTIIVDASVAGISLGTIPAISVGTTTVNLPFSNATGFANYNITWSAAAIAAGFVNVNNALLTAPTGLLPITVPATGPVSGTLYSGTFTIVTSCTGFVTNYGFNISFTGNNVLDNVTLTAANFSTVAYGLRRLSTTYNGPVMQIRRSSDGELRDVYFNGSDVLALNSMVSAVGGGGATATTLSSWIGSSSGTVAIWYDQSGRWRNASQPTVANQPRVINAGVIETQSGKPSIFYTGSSFLTHTEFPTTGFTGFSASVIARWTTVGTSTGNIQALIDNNHTGGQGFVFQDRPDMAGRPITYGIAASPQAGGSQDNIQTGNGSSRILTFVANNSMASGFRDGITLTTSPMSGTNYILQNRFMIGAWFANGSVQRYTTGHIPEVIVFPSALSTTSRTSLECNQSAYYTIPLGPPTITLLGNPNPIPVGTTIANLPYANASANQYSITWNATAAAAGFVNVTNTTLPVSSIPIAVPASGPVAGSFYTGILKVSFTCSASVSIDYPITVFITGSNNVLDNLNLTAANLSSVAYGLRKLSTTYNGPAMQIRRSSDGELRDVYFDGTGVLSLSSLVSAAGGGVATATTLSSWIGANSGTVAIWYDQSGRWRNAYQNIIANQPRVINAGVIETQNGKPAIFLNGTTSYLVESTLTVSNPYSMNTVASRTASNGNYQRLINLSSTGDAFGFLGASVGNYATFAGNGVSWNDANANAPARTVGSTSSILTMTAATGGSGLLPYVNGIVQNAKNGTAATSTGFLIGAPYSGNQLAQLWTGYISDFEIFPTILPATARIAMECNQSLFYNINTNNLTLGETTPVAVGNTSTSLPFSNATQITNYSITWAANAIAVGFVNVTNAVLPTSPIPVALPASGPVANTHYTGLLTVVNNCTGLAYTIPFNVYFIGNNVLDNLNLTASSLSSVAFGLRKLSSTYNGPAVKVRRSSDGEQRDVYFDGTALSLNSQVSDAGGGVPTATTLTAWIGSNSGTVAIWYDQSGLWRNAVQSTVVSQPRLINAGVIELQNGKPTLVFSGAQSFQSAVTSTQCAGAGINTTSNFVFQNSNVNSSLLNSNNYNIHAAWSDGNTYFDIPNRIVTALTWSNYSIGTFRRSGTQADVWKNGTNSLNTSTMSGTISGAAPMSIGSNINGKLGELTIFPSGLTTAARIALECNQSAYFNFPTTTPSLTLGQSTPITVGTTTTNLPSSNIIGVSNYNITWNAAALSAGFVNVTNALFANPLPIAVPATGPIGGQFYSGVLTVINNCSGLSTNYGFNVYFIGNNVLDNLSLTATTPAAVAYSLRKLSSTYNGPAVQIRRSSDGEQRDVYFDGTGALSLTTSQVSAAGGGEATATTLDLWIGSNSGTVTVWYDQSGLWRNATQNTVANQPRVINAGAIELQNGKPTLVFSGNQTFQSPITSNQCSGAGINTTSNFVFQNSTVNSCLLNSTNYNIHAPWSDGQTYFDIPSRINTPLTWLNYSIGTFRRNDSQGNVWRNGNNSLSSSTMSGTISGTAPMWIGSSNGNGNFINGKLGELTLFASAISAPARTAMECNQAAYYTITMVAPNLTLGTSSPISLGTTTANLPYTSANATNYSITWSAAAISAGFANVASTVLPAASIPVPVPAVGPVGGQSYTGVLTVTSSCSAGSASYPFTIFITGNNVLDNVNLTAANFSAVAYGLRRLSSAYTGPVMQIRRSSDGELRDVFFNASGVLALNSVVSAPGGGAATATTLSSWIGANSGTVAVWYDQSGQWRNASQPTPANQPRIINGGVIETQSGRPSILYTGSSFLTHTAFPTTGFTGFSANVIARWTTVGTTQATIQALLDNNHGSGQGFIFQDRPDIIGMPINYGVAATPVWGASQDNIQTGNGSSRILTFVADSSTASGFRDGIALTTSAMSGTNYILQNRFMIGAWFNSGSITRYTTGNIPEVIVFPNALSTTARVSLECNQGLYYSIPIVTPPVLTLGASTPISLGTTTVNLSYTNSTATRYSITWNAAAIAAGFVNVSNVTLPAGSIPVAVPAVGPVAGQCYMGILNVSTGCGSTNYPFTIFITGNNVLNNVALTAANFSSVAYGLRKLSSAYNGPAMQIRRSSDGELRDVYFNASGILTLSSFVSAAGGGTATATTLSSWIGANTGTVAIWYDQSGQWRNASQPTAANQPRVINAGVLETQNGVPSIYFTGSSFLTHTAFPTTGFTGFSANVISKWTTVGSTTASIQTLIDNNYAANRGFVIQDRPDVVNKPIGFEIKAAASFPSLLDNTQTGNGNCRILTFTATNTTVSGFRDGNAMPTASIANTNYILQNRFMIGAWFNNGSISRYTTGNIPEVMVFPSALSTIDRIALECNQRNYYNIALPTVTSPSINPTVCINAAMTNITHTTIGANGIGTPTGLPAGVTASYASNTITISGTPTVSGTFNYSIPLTEGCGAVNATGTIIVTPTNTWGAASSTPTVCINTTLTNITHTTVGATGIGAATGLPAGVTAAWASNVITISGTPTVAGTFPYSIPLTGGCGTVNATGTITVTNTGTVNTSGGSSTTQTLCLNTPLNNITYSTTGATGIGAATGLPPGVTAAWAANVITVSGTPTVEGTYNYSIPLTGGCGNITATGTITVNPNNTASAASATPTLCINSALTAITHSTTGTQGIGIANGLPPGVTASWASNMITITGTPTVTGTYNYSIPLIAIPIIGSCGVVNATGTITVINNTVSAASSMPTVCIDTPLTNITHTTTIATGIGVATGLPTGVTAAWASNTITISGTPTVSGTFSYSIPLTGGCGTIVNATGTITVRANNTAGTGSSAPTLCINSALTAITHTTTGATGIGAATGLPAGVTATWASNVITISGTPTVAGTFPYSIPLAGGCGVVDATGSITVEINTAGLPSSNPTLCINAPVLPNIIRTTTGATGIGIPTNLPPGVTAVWNTNVITISGTPTASGIFNYSIPLTGGCGFVNATGTITVNEDTVSIASSTPTLCINTALTAITHTTTGATGIGAASGLPAGVTATWSADVITISGTPTAAGIFAYSIPLTGGCGTVNATGTITINGPSGLPTLGSLVQPTCAAMIGSFIITNYNASYTYTASPSTGVVISGANVSAPAGTYTISASFAGCSSLPSA